MLLSAVALGWGPVPAAAQTRFVWPDTTIDYAAYSTVEECRAGAKALELQITAQGRLTSWRDTMPFDPRVDTTGELHPLPAPVVAAARRCATRFKAADTTLDQYRLSYLMPLYLMAGLDAEAKALVDRRIAASQKANPAADSARQLRRRRLGLLHLSAVSWDVSPEDSALMFYREARPFRRAAIEEILGARLRRARTAADRMGVLRELLNVAATARDTAQAVARATQLAAELERAMATEREKILDESETFRSRFNDTSSLARNAQGAAEAVVEWLYRRELLDSLRHGTPQWWAARRALWTRLVSGREAKINVPSLDSVSPMTAKSDFYTFWFRRDTGADTVRPTPGKVGLSLGVDKWCLGLRESPEVPGGERNDCWDTFAVLRRLGQRFPELQVTIHVRTEGAMGYSAYPDSTQEAELIRRWLHEGQRLPGALAVHVTSFSRLPDPDRRLVPALRSPDWPSGLQVIDREGRVLNSNAGGLRLFSKGLTRESEGEWVELIAALLQQPAALSRGSAAGREP